MHHGTSPPYKKRWLRNLDELKFAAAVAGLSKTRLIQMLQTQLSNLQMGGDTASDEDTNNNGPHSRISS